jgi:molybdopterin-guanine dinucleotide biosynthesis protein B
MPPIVSIVGKSESGKTTLMEKLLRELKSRGYRVATIKHSSEKLPFDEPGKDSWRHIRAGSEATLIISPDKMVLIKPTSGNISLEQLARPLGEDYDIILTEGFSQDDAPKIEVHRRQAGPLLASPTRLIAIATDEPLKTEVKQFSLEDSQGIVDLLEKDFIEPQQERVSLYVNDAPIALKSFPKQIVSNILLAIASSLKGVKKIKSLDFSLRKPPEKPFV